MLDFAPLIEGGIAESTSRFKAGRLSRFTWSDVLVPFYESGNLNQLKRHLWKG
jgi:hypothetical protein